MQNNDQPSKLHEFFTDKAVWITFFIISFILIIVISINYANSGSSLKSAYADLALPSTWKQKSQTINTGLEKCLGSDITCPEMSFSYDVSRSVGLGEDLKYIEQHYLNRNYKATKECYQFSTECKVLSFDINNGEVSISAWVGSNSSSPSAYVDIQEVKSNK